MRAAKRSERLEDLARDSPKQVSIDSLCVSELADNSLSNLDDLGLVREMLALVGDLVDLGRGGTFGSSSDVGSDRGGAWGWSGASSARNKGLVDEIAELKREVGEMGWIGSRRWTHGRGMSAGSASAGQDGGSGSYIVGGRGKRRRLRSGNTGFGCGRRT